jgi:hypothetical protein
MNRTSPKAKQNIFNDSQNVSQENLQLEQAYNKSIQVGLVDNHIGNGILPTTLTQPTIWDSRVYLSHYSSIDQTAIKSFSDAPIHAVSDLVNGNQLEISLHDTLVGGNKTVKVAIFGYDLNQNLIMDTVRFHKNESVITKHHYVQVKAIIVDDFATGLTLKANGYILIQEVKPLFVSRDPISLAQNYEPNLFFRDYPGYSTILNQALPDDNWSSLFSVPSSDSLIDNVIAADDYNTQIGEKFQATAANIRKVRLLLKSTTATSSNITLSIYPLQNQVQNQSSNVPKLLIEYNPDIIPITQVNISQSLDTTYRPVDFYIPVSAKLTVGSYYIITVKNNNINANDLYVASSISKWITNARKSTFAKVGLTNDGIWSDDTTKDLWFEIYSNAVKVSDGIYYENGVGTSIDKTLDGSDYCYDRITPTLNSAGQLLQVRATTKTVLSDLSEDERTGQPIFTSTQLSPSIIVDDRSEGLILGKFEDLNTNITSNTYNVTSGNPFDGVIFNGNEILVIGHVIPSVSFSTLENHILSKDLLNSNIVIGNGTATKTYSVDKASITDYLLGDIDCNGAIDNSDINALSSLTTQSWSSVANVTGDILKTIIADVDQNNSLDITSTGADFTALRAFVNGGSSTTIGKSFKVIRIAVSSLDDNRDDDAIARSALNILSDFPALVGQPVSSITMSIQTKVGWIPENLFCSNYQKYVPTIFMSTQAPVSNPENRFDAVDGTPRSKTDLYSPNNIILSGQILNEDGSYHKNDCELNSITLSLAGGVANQEINIDVFEFFVALPTGSDTGLTSKNIQAMKFADGTYIDSNAIANNQLRFTASVASYVPDSTASMHVGTRMNGGILTLSFSDMPLNPPASLSMITKVVINVYAKKSGFNNKPVELNSTQTANLLGIVSTTSDPMSAVYKDITNYIDFADYTFDHTNDPGTVTVATTHYTANNTIQVTSTISGEATTDQLITSYRLPGLYVSNDYYPGIDYSFRRSVNATVANTKSMSLIVTPLLTPFNLATGQELYFFGSTTSTYGAGVFDCGIGVGLVNNSTCLIFSYRDSVTGLRQTLKTDFVLVAGQTYVLSFTVSLSGSQISIYIDDQCVIDMGVSGTFTPTVDNVFVHFEYALQSGNRFPVIYHKLYNWDIPVNQEIFNTIYRQIKR